MYTCLHFTVYTFGWLVSDSSQLHQPLSSGLNKFCRICQYSRDFYRLDTLPNIQPSYESEELVWILIFPIPWPRHTGLYYLPIAGERRGGFMPFPKLFVQSKMSTVWFTIWTCFTKSILYNDNCYSTNVSIILNENIVGGYKSYLPLNTAHISHLWQDWCCKIDNNTTLSPASGQNDYHIYLFFN